MSKQESEGQIDQHDQFISEFARNSRQLYNYIRALAPNRHDADDVYQSTSLVMWRKMDSFQAGTSFLAWGRQIAFYEVCKLREQTGRGTLLSEQALDVLDASFRARLDDSSERLEALGRCLEKLSPASRRLIEQRYDRERSPAAIALELGQSTASVYRSLARTHHWLMSCIQHTLAGASSHGD
ncbi:sigma-70 family RNA polymerase sigma factor [Botrimarina hoheduenensis]|uniref:RNA polymerase sigma factor n=1 Tax=Botrimarina hoheduenensis TaxID=2528000 RepID=A0A5C5VQA4_9BACT|nr:sigma-70 family RNA polymerase sigma factor [Botrimarina hoheduenensis]TWT40115.1 RNA polymerase sigma factor [Botrimarina hoheduenensis]